VEAVINIFEANTRILQLSFAGLEKSLEIHHVGRRHKGLGVGAVVPCEIALVMMSASHTGALTTTTRHKPCAGRFIKVLGIPVERSRIADRKRKHSR
jgi:hypothetical protein